MIRFIKILGVLKFVLLIFIIKILNVRIFLNLIKKVIVIYFTITFFILKLSQNFEVKIKNGIIKIRLKRLLNK